MSKLRLLSALAAAATLPSSFALADHPGGIGSSIGAGPAITIPATTLAQGRIATFVIHEYVSLRTLSDRVLIDAAGRHQHAHSVGSIQSTFLGAAYGVTDDLTIALRLPFVRRSAIREGAHAHGAGGAVLNSVDRRGDSSGVGDLTLLGQWRFLNDRPSATEAAFLFGVRVPTGETHVRDRSGRRFETEFQPGSGSVNPLVGVAVTRRFGSWSFDANILHEFASKGVQQTNLGDRFLYNVALSYRLIGSSAPGALRGPNGAHAPGHAHDHVHEDGHHHDHGPEPAPAPSFALDGILELNGRWEDKERVAGVRNPNSGGNTVYLSPGLRASYANMSGFLSVGVPVANHANGLHPKPDYRIVSGITLSF